MCSQARPGCSAVQRVRRDCEVTRVLEDLKIRMYPDAAVLTGRAVQTTQQHGKDYNDAYRFTRVHLQHRGHWLSVALQLTHVETP